MTDPYPDIQRNKTVIAKIDCPCCGRVNPIRMNNANKLFFTCKWPTGDDGTVCLVERRYSHKETAEMMRKYNQDKLKMKRPQDANEEDTGTNTGTSAKRTGGVYDFYQ